MPMQMATITGKFVDPGLTSNKGITAHIRAVSDGSRLLYGSTVIAGRFPVHVNSNGYARVTLPVLPQSGLTPSGALWRLVFKVLNYEDHWDFTLTGDTTWDTIVDISNVPVTSSIQAAAEAARDAAIAAQAAAVAAAAGVQTNNWAATTAYVVGQIVRAPDGSTIASNSSRTSRASFDATEQGFWTVVFMKSGTLEQVAFDARTRSKYAPSPSGDTTGATDTAALVAALAGMGKTAGLATPTVDPLELALGAGPYYINPGSIVIPPGVTVRSKSRMGTLIYCVGGTVGQAFIATYDPSFTLSGGQLSSHGGEVSGLILDGTNAGRGTVGVLRGSLVNAKMDVMIRFFGANLTAGSTATSITVNGRSDTAGVTVGSSIVTDASVAIADLGTAVTGAAAPTGAVVTSLVKGVKFNLGTQAPAVANATGSGSVTMQVGWFRNDTVTLTSGSNFVPNTAAVAGDLNAPVFGTNIPKDAIIMAVDPGVGHYLGIPARGLLYQNQGVGWFERSDDRVEIFNCALGVVFDGATNNSYSYNKLHLTCDTRHDQKLIHLRGNPALFGQDWTVYGTFTSSGANNNGVGLMQSGSTGWRGRMEWHVESSNAGTQQAVPHFLQDSGSTFYGWGAFEFYCSPGFPAWQNAKRQIADLNANSPSAIGFKGMVGGVWGITDVITFGAGAARTVGAETHSNGLTNLASTTYSLFLESGSIFAVTLAGSGTAYTVAFNAVSFLGSQQGFDITFIVTQAGSGTASSISTWPASIKWTTGTAPAVNATFGSVTMYRLVSRDGGATWTGAAL